MKKVMAIYLIVFTFILAGCSMPKMPSSLFFTHSNESKKSEANSKDGNKVSGKVNTTKYVDYSEFSSDERQNVIFNFRGRDNPHGRMGEAAIIDMTVENEAKKPVLINPSKIFVTDKNAEFQSPTTQYKKLIELRPQEKIKVKDFFKNVSGQMFLDSGVYAYGDGSSKIAYVYGTFKKGGASTTNLQDPDVISMNEDENNDNGDQDSSDDSQDEITSYEDAIDKVKEEYGDSDSQGEIQYSAMNNGELQDNNGRECYWIRGRHIDSNHMSYDGLDYYVYEDGSIQKRE